MKENKKYSKSIFKIISSSLILLICASNIMYSYGYYNSIKFNYDPNMDLHNFKLKGYKSTKEISLENKQMIEKVLKNNNLNFKEVLKNLDPNKIKEITKIQYENIKKYKEGYVENLEKQIGINLAKKINKLVDSFYKRKLGKTKFGILNKIPELHYKIMNLINNIFSNNYRIKNILIYLDIVIINKAIPYVNGILTKLSYETYMKY